jgi:predicted ArsR family transcriptional regulator
MELLSIRNKKRIERLKARVNDKPLAQRVEEVAKIFSEDGYMTEWEGLPDGNFIIYQRHCAVHDLANQFRQLCLMEPQMMQALLGVKVTREKYILRDDPLCAYLVHASEQPQELTQELNQDLASDSQ